MLPKLEFGKCDNSITVILKCVILIYYNLSLLTAETRKWTREVLCVTC